MGRLAERGLLLGFPVSLLSPNVTVVSTLHEPPTATDRSLQSPPTNLQQ